MWVAANLPLIYCNGISPNKSHPAIGAPTNGDGNPRASPQKEDLSSVSQVGKPDPSLPHILFQCLPADRRFARLWNRYMDPWTCFRKHHPSEKVASPSGCPRKSAKSLSKSKSPTAVDSSPCISCTTMLLAEVGRNGRPHSLPMHRSVTSFRCMKTRRRQQLPTPLSLATRCGAYAPVLSRQG